MSQSVSLPISNPVRRSSRNSWEWWGRLMVAPYLLVFLIFVLYPVGYGLWLARHPSSYEHYSLTRFSFALPGTRWYFCWWPSTSK